MVREYFGTYVQTCNEQIINRLKALSHNSFEISWLSSSMKVKFDDFITLDLCTWNCDNKIIDYRTVI